MTQIARSLRLAHQMKQGRKHLGATAGFESLNKMPSTGDVLGVGGKRLRGKLKIAVIEREDGEAVVLMQAVEALQQRASGLLDRSARHRAGNVDHVKHLDGDALCRLNGGRESGKQKVGIARRRLAWQSALGREKERCLRLCALGLLNFQNEILIGQGRASRELNMLAAVGQVLD